MSVFFVEVQLKYYYTKIDEYIKLSKLYNILSFMRVYKKQFFMRLPLILVSTMFLTLTYGATYDISFPFYRADTSNDRLYDDNSSKDTVYRLEILIVH